MLIYWSRIDHLVDDFLLLNVFLSQTGHLSPQSLILTEREKPVYLVTCWLLDWLQGQLWFWFWSRIRIRSSYCLRVMILESMFSCFPFISWTSFRILLTSSADTFTSSWRTADTWTNHSTERETHSVTIETKISHRKPVTVETRTDWQMYMYTGSSLLQVYRCVLSKMTVYLFSILCHSCFLCTLLMFLFLCKCSNTTFTRVLH